MRGNKNLETTAALDADAAATAALSHPLVLGLGGKLRSGKDTVADYLVHEYGFVKIGMSDAVNEAMKLINPIVSADEGYIERYAALVERVGYAAAKENPEVRRLLQKLGTEVGRHMMGQNVWVDIAERKIREQWAQGKPVALTGMRFPNEIAMIRNLGGLNVYVERPSLEISTTQPAERVTAALDAAIHASENSVKQEDFSYEIQNDGTLVDLYAATDHMMAYIRSLRQQAQNSPHPGHFWPPYDH